jgi:hypothetical protein
MMITGTLMPPFMQLMTCDDMLITGTLTPPFMQLIAARGFPTVAVDIYSFFPFGESTFDVVHTSWVYHSGFTRHAIMEM